MKKKARKVSIDVHVGRWRKLLDSKIVDQSQLLLNARIVSCEMNALIKQELFSNADLRLALKDDYDWTRFCMLLDLHTIDIKTVKSAAAHVKVHRKGMSLSHLLYATKVKKNRERTSLLRRSMKNHFGVRKLKGLVDEKKAKVLVGGKEVRRPSNVIKQLNRVTDKLAELLATVSDPKFQSSIHAMDWHRHQKSRQLLESTAETLQRIGKEIPRSTSALRSALDVLNGKGQLHCRSAHGKK